MLNGFRKLSLERLGQRRGPRSLALEEAVRPEPPEPVSEADDDDPGTTYCANDGRGYCEDVLDRHRISFP